MEEEHPINKKIICQSCGMPMKKRQGFWYKPRQKPKFGILLFLF